MGRQKKIHKRFLIGLGKIHAQTLQSMANALGLTYSEVVTYLIDYYQLGK